MLSIFYLSINGMINGPFYGSGEHGEHNDAVLNLISQIDGNASVTIKFQSGQNNVNPGHCFISLHRIGDS